MREIDITKEMVECLDLFVDEDSVSSTYAMWFDVEAYFGVKIDDDVNTYINFYTLWKPSGDISALYTVDSVNSYETYDWELTEGEKAFFLDKMEKICIKQYGRTLQQMWEDFK
jgi:hypothetical protein